MTPEQSRKLDEVYAFMQKMSRYDQIPLTVSQALGRKLGLATSLTVSTSTKVATTEDQAVNEAGTGTYNVLSSPNGFLQVKSTNGTIYYIPYYT